MRDHLAMDAYLTLHVLQHGSPTTCRGVGHICRHFVPEEAVHAADYVRFTFPSPVCSLQKVLRRLGRTCAKACIQTIHGAQHRSKLTISIYLLSLRFVNCEESTVPACFTSQVADESIRAISTMQRLDLLSRKHLHVSLRAVQAKTPCPRPGRRAYRAVRSEVASQDLDDGRLYDNQPQNGHVESRAPLARSRSINPRISGTLPITSYHGLLSSKGKARNPGGLNTVLESYSEQPADDRIPLHGGLPHPDAFPFSELTVKLKSGTTLTIDNQDMVKALACSAS